MIDPQLSAILSGEQHRQASELEMIASENYISSDVSTAYANCFTNKYSEGYP
jgi:glycine hydroxymethyltransferase